MTGSNKTHFFLILAFIIIALYIIAVTVFIHPADYSESDKLFARCDACHPENADTIKSGEHYGIKCAGCHKISDFQENRHNSTIPLCSDCHSDTREGIMHTKSGHAGLITSQQNIKKEEKVYVIPANDTVQIQTSVNDK